MVDWAGWWLNGLGGELLDQGVLGFGVGLGILG